MDADWVPLLQTLSWVGLIGLVLGLNRRRLGNLLDEVIKRVREGSSFQAGPVSLGEAPRDIKSGRVEFATAEGAAGVTVSPSAEAFFDDVAAHMDGVDADRQDVYLVHLQLVSMTRQTTGSTGTQSAFGLRRTARTCWMTAAA
jgi:hypothetical protein